MNTFKEIDINKDNLINIEEFSRIIKIIDPNIPRNIITEIFAFFDINNDGSISIREFFITMKDSNEFSPKKFPPIILDFRMVENLKKICK